ncbi:hypothetical protein Fuma_03821 [Fuerstiella marisgermanici]|uniref:Uncharacterized protein n=1 Tax=Fuerstiella marisgermanici TaxID=1891926 RepID=A0A1P8WJI2_9PLAN|nr:hypothetical protein Fuma_03821 [Fuerstiella marisgermanici]
MQPKILSAHINAVTPSQSSTILFHTLEPAVFHTLKLLPSNSIAHDRFPDFRAKTSSSDEIPLHRPCITRIGSSTVKMQPFFPGTRRLSPSKKSGSVAKIAERQAFRHVYLIRQ